MRAVVRALAVFLLASLALAPARGDGPDIPDAPTTRPVERRAEAAKADQLAQLDADYCARKATILRRYVGRMTLAKAESLRAGEIAEAQRIFEAIAEANAEIAELDPAPAAAAQRPGLFFSLRVDDFDGAAGFATIADVTPTQVTVTSRSDYGDPPKVLWQSKLTPDQRERLVRYLRTFPLDRLGDRYVNPNVFDGYQVSFTIAIGLRPPRTIFVGNQRQRDLERLVDEVNELLPPRYFLSTMR